MVQLRFWFITFVETLLRMVPFPTRTGLIPIGHPGPDSPVLLTCNFHLTVERVKRALAGVDCWLLVANSHGRCAPRLDELALGERDLMW